MIFQLKKIDFIKPLINKINKQNRFLLILKLTIHLFRIFFFVTACHMKTSSYLGNIDLIKQNSGSTVNILEVVQTITNHFKMQKKTGNRSKSCLWNLRKNIAQLQKTFQKIPMNVSYWLLIPTNNILVVSGYGRNLILN